MQSLRMRQKVAPSFGFGTASRAQAGKVMEPYPGNDSPGPVKYTLPSQLGKQPDGRKKDPPIYSMGKADRFKLTGKLDPRPDFHEVAPIIGNKGNLIGAAEPRYGFGTASREQAGKVMEPYPGGDSPGPYIALPKSIGGKQPDGRKKDPPNWTLKGRDGPGISIDGPNETTAGRDAPGPKYNAARGIGKIPDSGFRTMPAYTLQSNARPPVEAGGHSPGPIYNLPSSLDKQVASNRRAAAARSAPKATFSKFSRWAHIEKEAKKNTVPGPGAYG